MAEPSEEIRRWCIVFGSGPVESENSPANWATRKQLEFTLYECAGGRHPATTI